MTDNENLIPIPGRLHSVAAEGHVSGADEIYDDVQQKNQETINSELIEAVGTGGSVDLRITNAVNAEKVRAQGEESTLATNLSNETIRATDAEDALGDRVGTLEVAVGTGGSVDSRIASAVATETSRAQGAESTLQNDITTETTRAQGAETELGSRVTTNESNIEALQEVYRAITQNQLTPKTSEEWAAMTSWEEGVIYRVQGTTSYADYMYNGTTTIKMAEYDNAIDNVPTAGSNNLVKSGGVQEELALGAVYDVSAKNHTAGPNNDGKFESLSTLLEDANLDTLIPASVRRGGMSIRFVQSSDNKYVQYRYTGTDVTGSPNPFLDTDNWQSEILDDIPTDGSNNPVKSGGVAAKIGIGNGKFPNDVISTAELESYIFAFLTKNQKIFDALDDEGKRHIFTDLIIRELYQVGKMSNPEMFLAEIDSYKKIHHYVDLKGLHHFLAGIEVDRLYGIYKNSNPEVFLAEIDKNNNMHHYVDYQGIHYFPAGIVTPTLSYYKKLGEIKIQMPKVINIVQGQNISLYNESVLQNVWAKDYNVNKTNVSEINLVQHSKTPSSHDQTIIIYDEFEKKLAEQNIHVNILPASISGNLKVCMLGDSKTENTTSMCEVLNLCEKNGNLSIQYIGTKQAYVEGKDSDGNSRNPKHEATSGSSIESLCKTNISAFYDSTMSGDIKFNLSKGFTEIGDIPDILWLNYGANQGVYSSVSVYYDYIINAVKAYNTANNTNIKVVISIQEQFATRSRLPYAFNSPYNMGITKRSFDVSLQDYINAFENREDEGIYICPQYINVDLYNDFPLFKAKISPRCNVMKDFCADAVHMGVNSGNYDANTTYTYGDIVAPGWEDRESLYCCVGASVQGIAPNDDKINWSKCDNVNAGYYKIADVMFATLMYIRNIINN